MKTIPRPLLPPHRAAACALALGLACVLAACSSRPAPRFHSLLATTPEASASAPATETGSVPAAPWAIEIASVSVPPAVDQAQWVVRMPDDSLRILEQEQWVAPLRDELRLALADRLAHRFGAVDPHHADARAHAWRVIVDVQRFESIAAREAWLEADWSARPDDSARVSVHCRASLHEAVDGGPESLGRAHRRNVARLADQIGEAVQRAAHPNGNSVSAPPAASCPAP